MSYNTAESAENLVRQSVDQGLLDVARSMIDLWSDLRWESTTVTDELYSGENIIDEKYLYIRMPIITVTTLTVDDVSLTEDTDFTVKKNIGRIKLYVAVQGEDDNISITYNYGYTDSHESYKAVVSAEAQIGLYLKKNPIMMRTLGASGMSLAFDENHISSLLIAVPRMMRFGGI